jgi:rhodanese-related sulfurtransferase
MTEPDSRPTNEPVDLDTFLAEARRGLDRLEPGPAFEAVERGALLVDIRPVELRARDGEIPGSVVIDRNVVEWRLAPSSPHRLAELDDPDRVVIIACSQGYASSLAAAGLRRLGVNRATDLVGGYLSWKAAGLPTVAHGDPSVRSGTQVDADTGAG